MDLGNSAKKKRKDRCALLRSVLRSGPQPPRVLSMKETKAEGRDLFGASLSVQCGLQTGPGPILTATDTINPLDPRSEVHSGAMQKMKSS